MDFIVILEQWIRSMTLKKLKWTISVAAILLIGILLGIGWMVFHWMDGLENRLNVRMEDRWTKVQLASDAVRYSSRNNRITMQIFLLNGQQEIAPLLAERARNSDAITEVLRQISSRIETEEERELLNKLWSARKPYVGSYKEALALLLEQGEFEKARVIMVRTTLPLLIRYHDLWEQFVRLQGDEMRRVGFIGQNEAHTAQTWMAYLLATGVCLVLGLWCFTLWFLPKPAVRDQFKSHPAQQPHAAT
jgi:hypothetical protein